MALDVAAAYVVVAGWPSAVAVILAIISRLALQPARLRQIGGDITVARNFWPWYALLRYRALKRTKESKS